MNIFELTFAFMDLYLYMYIYFIILFGVYDHKISSIILFAYVTLNAMMASVICANKVKA
jgi:hypothetical protein